jgi:hypothetical protein
MTRASERLTPYEREFAERLGGIGARLLAIHDAQAAALERVRALGQTSVGGVVATWRIRPAPSQAAEPVKECANCGCVTYGHVMRCCDAQDKAEARVAELEAKCITLRVNNRVLEADNADQIDRRRALQSRVDEASVILACDYTAGERALEVLSGR